MERKIPVWILALVVFLGINFTVIFGWAVYLTDAGGKEFGAWGPVVVTIAAFPSLVKKVFVEVNARPPLLIDNRFPEIDGFKKHGVMQDGAISDGGYLLLSAYDNSKNQSIVKLIRIHDQKIVHEWVPNINDLTKNFSPSKQLISVNDMMPYKFRIGHPLLLNDGSLIFHNFEGPLYNIDICSKKKWIINQHFHHAIERDDEGNVWVSSIMEPVSYRNSKFIQNRDDAIAKVSPDGSVLFKKSVAVILEENGYRGLLIGTSSNESSAIHLNEVQPALSSTRFWAKGDLLISMRHRSTVFIYRPSTSKIIWLQTGPWLNQHDPEFLGESKISVFGNDIVRAEENSEMVNGQNEIYLFDFRDNTVSTPYSKVLRKMGVQTLTEGRQKILENGDVFVDETNYGRLLRLSPDKEIWEFMTKVDDHTAGMTNWSRYLTSDEVKDTLPVLISSNCQR